MSHYSGNYSGSGGAYSSAYSGAYSRSRDSDPGHNRDQEWGRDWRNDNSDTGSRDRDKQRQRSPSGSREKRYSDYNRSRRQQYSPADDHGSRYSKFNNSNAGGKYGNYNYRDQPNQSGYPSTTALIREKDLQRCQGVEREPGFDANGSYDYDTQCHYSQFPKTEEAAESSATIKGKNPMDNPLFKAAIDTCIMNMKTKGDYDLIRRECMSDIDTKASFINLQDRVKSTVDTFLGSQVFTKDFDKVKAREMMRKRILNAPYFEKGIESVVDQILIPRINEFVRPKIEAEVYRYLNSDNDKSAEALPSPPSSNQTNNEAEVLDTMGNTETKIQDKPVNLNEGSENVPSSSDKGLPNDVSMNFVPGEGTDSLVECDKKVSSGSCNNSPETRHYNEYESTPNNQPEEEVQAEAEDDSEEESPMFEKLGDVSPPRVVVMQNSDLVEELSKELIGEKTNDAKPVDERKNEFYLKIDENFGDDKECKSLESTPLYDYKVSYYKRIEKKVVK